MKVRLSLTFWQSPYNHRLSNRYLGYNRQVKAISFTLETLSKSSINNLNQHGNQASSSLISISVMKINNLSSRYVLMNISLPLVTITTVRCKVKKNINQLNSN